MDDRHAYMLNELWTRQYDLGRVLRFRHIQRGRQATCYEVLTAEQRTFTAYVFPAALEQGAIIRACEMLPRLDKERFSVVPMVQTLRGGWIAEGPQGGTLVVGLEAVGQVLLPDQWTLHDMTQLGLRLAWMHRLMREQWPLTEEVEIATTFDLACTAPGHPRRAALRAEHLAALGVRLEELEPPVAWAHGDLQPAAMLLDSDRQIRTVVDWALLHPGDPLEDLVDAFVHWCVASDGTVNVEAGRALLESYRTLRQLQDQPWEPAVLRWCAQRVIDGAYDRRMLPRGFATVLADPKALASALEFCEVK